MSAAATAVRPAPAALPFFRFGTASGAATVPLGIVSGGLLVDSGEADATFVYRCQDRYLAYAWLTGLRTVLFVRDDAHAARYAALLAQLRARYAQVAAASGVLPPRELHEPLYVACDAATLQLAPSAAFARGARALRAAGAPVELCFNQIAPSTARLAAQLDALLRAHGVPTAFDRAACHAAGALSLFFHDKASSVALVRGGASDALPPHAPTALLAPAELAAVRDWAQLVALYRARSGDAAPLAALYVKSSRDSGGNGAARLSAAGFAERFAELARELARGLPPGDAERADQVARLRGEIALAPSLHGTAFDDRALAAFARAQAARRVGMTVLVQREIAPDPRDARCGGIGLTYLIDGPAAVAPHAVAAQVYADPERRHFLGARLDDALAAAVLTPALADGMAALCRRYGAVGYRGPINFDARLDAAGRYVLIHDCNPRLSAVYPALAVRDALRAAGLRPRSILSLGYRGEFVAHDVAAFLARLDARGVLCTAARPRGALVLPNLARADGFDALLIDVGADDAAAALAALRACADDAAAAAGSIYA